MPIWGWRGRPEYIHGKVIDTGRLGLEVKGTDDPGQLVAECSSAQLVFIRILLGLTVIAGGDQYARLARTISQGREARSEVGSRRVGTYGGVLEVADTRITVAEYILQGNRANYDSRRVGIN